MSAATGVASDDVSDVNAVSAHAGAVDAANPSALLSNGPDVLLDKGWQRGMAASVGMFAVRPVASDLTGMGTRQRI
jgi:hypothetical protein